MSPPLTPPPAPLTCLRCGYDLRGLADGANCPECSLPAARSIANTGELRHAPPAWLASVTAGTAMILGTLLGLFPYYGGVAAPLVRTSFEQYVVCTTAFWSVFAAGAWLLTRPQRGFPVAGPALRWAIRVCAVVLVAHSGLTYLVVTTRWRYSPMLVTAAAACVAPLPTLVLLYLRRLALRVPSPRVAWQCRAAAWGAPAAIAIQLVDDLLDFPPRYGLELAAAVLGGASFVLSLYLLVRLAIAFRRAHRESVAAWGGVG
jgi:hypothetical protein